MSSYGGGYNAYPPLYGNQQLLNYPAAGSTAAYYNGMTGAGTLMNGGYNMGGYYPNSNYLTNYGLGSYGYGGMNGYGGTYGQYGYLPYKPSTLRTIYNRIRHGSSYAANYPYYNNGGYPQMGYEYGRHHRGSWIDYQ
jgi:hypothetical protein